MSKSQLKKELQGFTKEQLIDLILDTYSASKKFKEYFEFFIAPDSKALFEKYSPLLDKEFKRSKWGRSKARISVVKNIITDFCSFSPDIKYVYLIYRRALVVAMINECFVDFPETLFNGLTGIVKQYLKLADSNGDLDKAVKALRVDIIDNNVGTVHFARKIKYAIDDYISSQAI